jgi:hypothetical protein
VSSSGRRTTTSLHMADLRGTQMTDLNMTTSRLLLGLVATAALAVALALTMASSARADLSLDEVGVELNKPPRLIKKFDLDPLSPTFAQFIDFPATNADGTFVDPDFDRQAGGHPDLSVDFRVSPRPDGRPAESVRSFMVDLPPGLIGDPTAVPTCAPTLLKVVGVPGAACPLNSQVGVAEVRIWNKVETTDFVVGIYNISHGPNVPALFGFNYTGVIGLIGSEVDPADYHVASGTRSAGQGAGVAYVKTTIWGVPADPSHDTLRGSTVGVNNFNTPSTHLFSSPAARAPFLTAPPRCSSEPLEFRIHADSWENPGKYVNESFSADVDGTPFLMEGCERVPFDPSTDVTPSARSADSPTGLDVEIEVPQPKDPDGIASAHVRKVKTTLPEGMRVNAASATGLGACSQAEIKLGTNDAPACPDSSKLGTVDIETPLLEEVIHGDVFLAKQGDNPFNSLLALYIAVKGPGFYLKLPGKIETDPNTGQVTTVFDNNPQLPFEKLHLSLNGGPRAAITTPRECGTYSVKTEFTSWKDDNPVVVDSPFQVNEGCGGGFSPSLEAGTVDPKAGSFSPFVLRLTRKDGEGDLAKLSATLPQGLLAKLAGVPLCGDAQAATGGCPAGSQVGKVTIGTGSGPTPLYVPEAGKAPTAAYLAGPYKGAPYSLVVKVPAQAGPFDLGTVSVRNALNVDPITAQVTAASDQLPQILQGIPIAYRDVRVEVNRPDFTINPTNCKPKQITSVLTSTSGQTATPSSPFQVAGCKELGFKPKLALKFTGDTNRSAHPALKATLTMPNGGANIGKTVVLLPGTEFIDNAHISNPCTRVQFDAGACPKGSILGTATAYTPLLDKPLSGPVYFRSNGGARELPDLVADLNGAIHLTVVGFIDSVKTGPETARVRTRFVNVPDTPVSKFVLSMKGGDKGLLVNNTELCKVKPRARAEFTGQNGKRSVTNPLVKLGCGGGKKR